MALQLINGASSERASERAASIKGALASFVNELPEKKGEEERGRERKKNGVVRVRVNRRNSRLLVENRQSAFL